MEHTISRPEIHAFVENALSVGISAEALLRGCHFFTFNRCQKVISYLVSKKAKSSDERFFQLLKYDIDTFVPTVSQVLHGC
jgi:hypothetical protein